MILSIILGVLIPVVYTVPLLFGEGYIPEKWMFTTFYGQTAPGGLLAPISVPIYFYIFAKENRVLPLVLNAPWFRASSFVLFNWILYGLIAYLILGRFKRFGKRSASATPPPEFEK